VGGVCLWQVWGGRGEGGGGGGVEQPKPPLGTPLRFVINLTETLRALYKLLYNTYTPIYIYIYIYIYILVSFNIVLRIYL